MSEHDNTISQMTSEIVEMFNEYTKQGTPQWTYQTAAQDLPYQVGSLTKLLMQREGNRYREGLSDEEIRTKVADELSDILADVLFIAHELGIDLNEAWRNMLASDEQKISKRSTK